MIRKASAALGLLVVTLVAFGAMAIPAFAQVADPYPPIVTTTTVPTTTTTAASGGLAFTGSNSVSLLVIALVALTVGVVALVAVRRRGSVQATKS